MSEQAARAPEQTPYEAMGGHRFFAALVHRFYTGVRRDPVLRPLYPEDELDAAEERLRMFLEQYWGGPRTYSEQRGHPRLRMRHGPFAVTPTARDAWLAIMGQALEQTAAETGLDPALRARLWDYLVHAAHFMVNTFDER